MSKSTPIVTYERSKFSIKGESVEGGVELPADTFELLWEDINSSTSDDKSDVAFSHGKEKRKRIIRVNKYVGTIQTKDGTIIEILPKIYKSSGQQESDAKICRQIFLRMLAAHKKSKAYACLDTALDTAKNFPIFEMLIRRYVLSVEQLIRDGIRKDYVCVSENFKYLKGRLKISQHIQHNSFNKTRFFIEHEKYIYDIAPNRIIVSTLFTLMKVTHNATNRSSLLQLINCFDGIPKSQDINKDLLVAKNTNRLFRNYSTIIDWSEQFLNNKSYSNFSGRNVNQSFLFNAEKLFEDFVSKMFVKYTVDYDVKCQDTKCHLADHRPDKLFQMKPDIVLFPKNGKKECLILDAKWKNINETLNTVKKHYNIDEKDMYQLYAYGRKYQEDMDKKYGKSNIKVYLALIYPMTEKFTKALPPFILDNAGTADELKLTAIPFDLTDPSQYEKQISDIINLIKI